VTGLEYIKVGGRGPRAVLRHQFGHHVQYEDNMVDSPLTGPGESRLTHHHIRRGGATAATAPPLVAIASDDSTKGCGRCGRTPWCVSGLVRDGCHGALDP
jgi:hypothetical protein